jgi:hypothetical protein
MERRDVPMTGSSPTGVKSSVPCEYLVSRKPLHENTDLCAECDGYCCRHHAGAAYPEDFGRSRAERLRNLRAALETGSWSVDWWEGNPSGCLGDGTAYYVRPAHTVRRFDSVRDPSWGGTCVFFEKGSGCALPPDRRPTGCRDLKPERDHVCSGRGNDKECACVAWWQYRDDVERIVEEVDAKMEGTTT